MYVVKVKMASSDSFVYLGEGGQPWEFADLNRAREVRAEVFAGEGDLGDLAEVYSNSEWDPVAVQICRVDSIEEMALTRRCRMK